jgi:signal transduction histidine kinase
VRGSLDSLRLQAAVIGLASVSMAALAVILIQDALSRAEQTLLGEARQQSASAARELSQQLLERASVEEDPLAALPVEAQDLSLRGLSGAVLRAYEGIEGGFLLVPDLRVVGYTAPTRAGKKRGPTEDELQALFEIAADVGDGGRPLTRQRAQGTDWLVFGVAPVEGAGSVAWTLKRLSGARDPVGERRRWWLAGLVLSALVGLGGVISISVRLRRGADTVSAGLARLESDPGHRLPALGGELGRIAAAVNRTAERRAALETTVRQQDRLAALGKVVAGVAHEIRNPLNSIRLGLELLQRRLERGTARVDEVRGAMEEVDRLDRILARLLAFGRPALEDRALQPIAPLVDRAVAMVHKQSEQKRVSILVEGEGTPPPEADVDGLQVEQVLINLLLNAIEASPDGGTVRLGLAREDESVRIAVSDHGSGIPKEAREHVFDPYFTTRDSGNGLGLAVSREVVAHHGGSLSFDTDATGTTFTLSLPVRRSGT